MRPRVYEFCDKARGVGQIEEMLQEIGDGHWPIEATQPILDDLVRRDLIVKEDGRYLSLAVMA